METWVKVTNRTIEPGQRSALIQHKILLMATPRHTSAVPGEVLCVAHKGHMFMPEMLGRLGM